MKKLFLINAILTGVLVCLFLTSGNEQEVITYPYYTHHYEEDEESGRRYIIPDKFREFRDPLSAYGVLNCNAGLYFSCKTKSCVYPSEACECVKGL